MEHALPRRTAGIPRTWSLCMISENHGTVGPAGCTFSHAPDKHERVLVVEVPTAAGAPVDQVNLQLVGARRRRPVAEFKGYVDGQPAVTWLDRANMPRVGTKLYAAPVDVQGDPATAPLPAGQSMIGKLLDQFSELPVLWGLNEPGALVRHSDVFKMLVAAGKAAQASTSGERQEGGVS